MANTSKGAQAERFRALDSIRGLLASTVVIFHVRAQGYLWDFDYFSKGYLAVTFFFVLSGFVISTTYADRLAGGFPLKRFFGLRLGRIYPLHLAMILLLLAWEAIRLVLNLPAARHGAPFTGMFDAGYLPYNFALLQKFADRLSWNDPSWSIGVEWWTYIAFALLTAPILLRRAPLLVAMILLAPWVFERLLSVTFPRGFHETVDCMATFGLGMSVWLVRRWPIVWRHTDRIGWRLGTLAELAALGLALWMISIFGGKFSPAIGPIFAIVIAVFSLERGAISRLLLTAPMLLLGELSYSIYMTHHFTLDRVLDLLQRFGPAMGAPVHVVDGNMAVVGDKIACDIVSLVVLAAAIPISYLSYRYIETPARLWSRRVLNPNHRATVTPPDPTAAF